MLKFEFKRILFSLAPISPFLQQRLSRAELRWRGKETPKPRVGFPAPWGAAADSARGVGRRRGGSARARPRCGSVLPTSPFPGAGKGLGKGRARAERSGAERDPDARCSRRGWGRCSAAGFRGSRRCRLRSSTVQGAEPSGCDPAPPPPSVFRFLQPPGGMRPAPALALRPPSAQVNDRETGTASGGRGEGGSGPVPLCTGVCCSPGPVGLHRSGADTDGVGLSAARGFSRYRRGIGVAAAGRRGDPRTVPMLSAFGRGRGCCCPVSAGLPGGWARRGSRGVRTGLWTRRAGEVRRGRAGRHRAQLPAPGGAPAPPGETEARGQRTALPGRGHPWEWEGPLLCLWRGCLWAWRAAGRGVSRRVGCRCPHTGVPDQDSPPHSGSHLLDRDS